MGNYNKIIEKISKASGLKQEEIERRVEAKRAKLSGLISKDGALQVVAAELGINFENEKFKLDELLPGMRKVNVIGKIISIFPVRSFEKNGKGGKVANFTIADETSNMKVVLWDTHHIDLIERGKVKEGSVVEIINANMRENEIHLGSFSEFKPSTEIIENVNTTKIIKQKKIFDFKPNESIGVRAFIVQSFEPRFFNVCSQCKKKVTPEGENFLCAEHGVVAPEKRALINVVLDDGTETIRAVLFHENIPKIGITALEDVSLLTQQRENLLGKEMVFSGNVRTNKFFNTQELIIDEVNEVNLNDLISSLENVA